MWLLDRIRHVAWEGRWALGLCDFGLPLGEDVVHLGHPFWGSACEVVLDGAVAERDEVVVFVVGGEG